MTINLEKAPRKASTRKQAIAPNYNLAPAEPCPFVGAPVPVAVPVDAPVFVAGTGRTVDGVDYTVALYSDDSVRIARDDAPAAYGRFVATARRTDYGYSVESRIVDVTPAAAVPADIVESLAVDLTYFAMRAGRFAHCHRKAVRS